MNAAVLIGWILVAASIVAGVYYSVLGILALKHLPDFTKQDRFVGWTLWWFVEVDRYDEAGKHLCRCGGTIFVLALCLAVPGYYLALQR